MSGVHFVFVLFRNYASFFFPPITLGILLKYPYYTKWANWVNLHLFYVGKFRGVNNSAYF